MKSVSLRILRSIYLFFVAIVFFFLLESFRSARKKKKEIKRKLKYFAPVISEGFWGTKITWIGRDKPLTNDELDNLTEV